MWEVSENEESILPILRLSYYDLPYYLRRCFTFCAIFPKDTEIEKEKLIQLWMAHDLISTEKNQELEDNGNIIWDELRWRSFFQEEKLNWEGVQTCKMHDLMHDLAQSIMKDEYYTIDARSTSKDFGQEIRHLTIIVDEPDNVPLSFLKNKGGLKSLILTGEGLLQSIILPFESETFLNGSFRFLKKLSSLRVFEVPKDVQSLNLCYLRYLKHLRYLILSDNGIIKTLPDSICGLLNLQTLKLDNCSKLESLPRNTKDLINLRHLHLKGCCGLKYMPRGMKQLKNLKTLSLFVIGKESDSQLDELKELDIGGHLYIKNLERVSDVSLARGISMLKSSSINKLELYWRDENDNRHEKIGEALEVSSTCLKGLKMIGYKGVNIPKWVGESSASLTYLELLYMNNVQHIFTMNNINTIGEIGVLDQLFPLLEVLNIDCMENLMELVSPPIPITTTGAGTFPNLHKILINNCPRLGALPSHLKSLKNVKVNGECRDELLDSIISNHSGLTQLYLSGMSDRRVFVGSASTSSHDVVLFPLLEKLDIENMRNLREFVSPPVPITTTGAAGAFPNLRKIVIKNCPNLGALPPHLTSLKNVIVEGECCDELLHSVISNQSGLTNLEIWEMNERIVLFPGANNDGALMIDEDNNEAQAGGPSTNFQSHGSLNIVGCPKLRCLFDVEECEELAAGGERERVRERTRGGLLRNLREICISSCPELTISAEQWRNLITPSLQRLWISDCRKLVPSKEEEAKQVMALLSSLRPRLGRERFCVDFLRGEEEEIYMKRILMKRSIYNN